MSSLTATIGLHSSASTWVFNVARELLIAAHGEGQVVTCYTDDVAQLPSDAARHRLIKSHHGSPKLDAWLAEHQARLILSIRDPRDACLSMAKRFNATLDLTARWLSNDCNRLAALADDGYPILRYEDRFFDHAATVSALAARLDVALPDDAIDDIFARYRTEEIRRFAENLASLPPRRIASVGASIMDSVTQIHATHIGDTATGKWRRLSEERQASLTQRFAGFLERFGYPL